MEGHSLKNGIERSLRGPRHGGEGASRVVGKGDTVARLER